VYFLYKNEYRIFKLVEIAIKRGLSGKEKNREDEPIQVIIHIYGNVIMKYPVILSKQKCLARHWCHIPVILTTQEAEIRRIKVQSQPGQLVCETLSQNTLHKKTSAGGVAQGVGPEFKPWDPSKCLFFQNQKTGR
jgi:hypothetical protein